MSKKKISAKQLRKKTYTTPVKKSFWGVEVLLVSGLGLFTFLLRVVGQLDKVLVKDIVVFRGTDAWYHMRLADSLMVNYPRLLLFDRYLIYPQGSQLGFHPLLSFIIATLGKLGLNYEVAAAFLPPIFGSLCIVFVYLIGKHYFSKGAGVCAAIIAAILPGEFFHRSLLGFTDHHILEVFFMLGTIYFITLALAREKYKFVVAAGVFLGFYFLNWHGNLLFTFILMIWFLAKFLSDYYKGKDVKFYSKSMSITLLIGAVLLSSYLLAKGSDRIYLIVSFGVAAIPYSMYKLSNYLKNKELFFLSLVGIILGGIVFVGIFYPSIIHFGVDSFRAIFMGFDSPISEGRFTTIDIILNNYGLSFLFGFLGLIILIWKRQHSFIVVWSVFMLAATIGERRWGYYFAVNASVLTGYLIYEVGKWVKPTVKSAVIVVMFFFIILVSIRGTIDIVSLPNNISPGWYNSLLWLKDNTPSQFSTDVYYDLEVKEDPSYGVLVWWDYGHWVTRISHRVPSSNPANWGTKGAFRFFPAQTLEEAETWISGLKIRYIIVDQEIIDTKFRAIMEIVGLKGDVVSMRDNSMAYRLYTEGIPGYILVHSEPGVKIFERENWNN